MESLKAWVKDVAASELAHKLKLPVSSFVETMNKYQEYQTTGEDLEFGRNANEMPRVKSPVAFMEATAWAAMLLRTSLYSAR